jgi:hypothetical protein
MGEKWTSSPWSRVDISFEFDSDFSRGTIMVLFQAIVALLDFLPWRLVGKSHEITFGAVLAMLENNG